MKHHFKFDPAISHMWFAWHPVLVIDRTTGAKYYAWLERVQRRLASNQGVASWVYTPL